MRGGKRKRIEGPRGKIRDFLAESTAADRLILLILNRILSREREGGSKCARSWKDGKYEIVFSSTAPLFRGVGGGDKLERAARGAGISRSNLFRPCRKSYCSEATIHSIEETGYKAGFKKAKSGILQIWCASPPFPGKGGIIAFTGPTLN